MCVITGLIFYAIGAANARKQLEADAISSMTRAIDITSSIAASIGILEDSRFTSLQNEASSSKKAKDKGEKTLTLINYVIENAEGNQAYLDELFGARNRVTLATNSLS